MTLSLEGVRLKVARAEEHLEALRVECSTYLDNRPYEPVRQSQSEDHNEDLLIWKVHHKPPLRLSVIFGDLLHNLRSSLDHIAWQLVLTNGGTPNKKTRFPILLNRGSNSPTVAGGISPKAATLLEGIQPYNNASGVPHEDPLYVLSTLNNIDKHREFNIAVLNVSEMLEAHLLTQDSAGIYMTFQFLSNVGKDEPITDGAVVGRPPFPPNNNQKWAIEVQSRLGLQETNELSSLGSPTLVEVAEDLLAYLRDNIVPQFEQIIEE
jgi:hypothetical protein